LGQKKGHMGTTASGKVKYGEVTKEGCEKRLYSKMRKKKGGKGKIPGVGTNI